MTCFWSQMMAKSSATPSITEAGCIMFAKTFLAIFLALAFKSPALAERVGIAFVQAPAQGSGVCAGNTPDDAFACAIKQCVKSGAESQNCIRTNWCFPSGWSADVFLLHNEGVHWHEVTCGWPSQNAALEAAKITCDRKERDFIVDCTVVQIYDPEGKPQLK